MKYEKHLGEATTFKGAVDDSVKFSAFGFEYWIWSEDVALVSHICRFSVFHALVKKQRSSETMAAFVSVQNFIFPLFSLAFC